MGDGVVCSDVDVWFLPRLGDGVVCCSVVGVGLFAGVLSTGLGDGCVSSIVGVGLLLAGVPFTGLGDGVVGVGLLAGTPTSVEDGV